MTFAERAQAALRGSKTRLEDLIGEVTQRAPYRAIAQAINLVIFIERTPTGRRIWSVTSVLGWDGDGCKLEPLGI